MHLALVEIIWIRIPLQKRSGKYTAVIEFAFIWQHYRKRLPLREWAPMSSSQATVCCQRLSTVKLIIPLHIQQLVSRPFVSSLSHCWYNMKHSGCNWSAQLWSSEGDHAFESVEIKTLAKAGGPPSSVLTNCAVIKVWTRKCPRPRKMGDLTRGGGTSSTRTWRRDCDETKGKRAETPLKKHKTTAQNPPPRGQRPSSDEARQVRNYQGQHLTTRHRCWNQGVTKKKKGGKTETGRRAQKKIQGDETIDNKTGDAKTTSSWQYESFSEHSVQRFAHWNWLRYFTMCYLVQSQVQENQITFIARQGYTFINARTAIWKP